MDIKSLRNQDEIAIKKQLSEARGRLQELKFKASSNQLKDVREIREVKKAIAQMHTVLSEKA